MRNYQEKRKRAEANARRQLATRWDKLGHKRRYRRAAMRNDYRNIVSDLKDELFDGILINLSDRYSDKSLRVQKRVLRRIVEKRQSQAAYRHMGRRDDLLTARTAKTCTKRCMRELNRFQQCR